MTLSKLLVPDVSDALLVGESAVSPSEVGASPQPVIATSADNAIAVWIVCLIFMKVFLVVRFLVEHGERALNGARLI